MKQIYAGIHYKLADDSIREKDQLQGRLDYRSSKFEKNNDNQSGQIRSSRL